TVGRWRDPAAPLASASRRSPAAARRPVAQRSRALLPVGLATIEHHRHRLRLFAPLEIGFDPLGVQLHAIEVFPDPRVVRAAVPATDSWARHIRAAEPRAAIAMRAETVGLVADVIRAAEIPAHGAGFDFFNGEREVEFAADGM